MLFGLANALTIFQWFMNEVFGDLLDVYVIVYLNGILIYSNNLEDYHGHVTKVLSCL